MVGYGLSGSASNQEWTGWVNCYLLPPVDGAIISMYASLVSLFKGKISSLFGLEQCSMQLDIWLLIIFFTGVVNGLSKYFVCSGYQWKGKSSYGVGTIEAGISTTTRVWFFLIFLNININVLIQNK